MQILSYSLWCIKCYPPNMKNFGKTVHNLFYSIVVIPYEASDIVTEGYQECLKE